MVNAEAQAMLDPLFSELKDGISLSQRDAGLIYMNAPAARLLGQDAQELEGRSICDIVCARLEGAWPEGAGSCPLRRREGRSATAQGRFGPRPNYRWGSAGLEPTESFVELRARCQVVTTPLFDSWGFEKLLTILEDVSAERELERHKEDWRNMVAHDLRSPMTNIFGTLRLFEDSPAREHFSEAENSLLAASLRSARRLLSLLNLYLDVAKLDAGLMRARRKPVDLGALAASCADEQQMAAREGGVRLELAVEPGARALADEDLLFRVLQNLLANAVKYSPRGGKVILSSRRDGPFVELSVRDEGPGIAAPDMKRLFDRFYQAEERRGGRFQGTGLGLTFCREALRLMGGTVTAESKGKGSVFTMKLEAAKDKEETK